MSAMKYQRAASFLILGAVLCYCSSTATAEADIAPTRTSISQSQSFLLRPLVRGVRSDHCTQCGNPNAKFCCKFFEKCCDLVCGEDMNPCWPPVSGRSCSEERCSRRRISNKPTER